MEDSKTGKDALAAIDTVLIDTVSYENLTVGRTYKLTGVLMDKDTGEEALDDDGNIITASTTFTPTSSSGYVTVTFEFSGVSLAGHTVVSFETLYRVETNTVVTTHEEIGDEGQTIYIPKITTKLTQTGGSEKVAFAHTDLSFTDVISYENLLEGETYVVEGKLMVNTIDEDGNITSKALLDDDGNEITAATEFTVEEGGTTGEVSIVYNFDGETLAGNIAVSYVEVYRKLTGSTEKLIAEHEDINDEDQSVDIIFQKLTLETGGSGRTFIYLTGTLMILLLAAGYVFLKKKKTV